MGWTDEEVAKERPILEALATFKYDEYQQFSPGMRFIESLAVWLSQFDIAERRIAYKFIVSKLIFISESEIKHLVSIAYPDYIQQIMINSALKINKGLSNLSIRQIVKTKEFKLLLRRSLFLGLSDGAHTDIFRRSNPSSISHEQVYLTYEIADERAKDMQEKLSDDIKIYCNENEIEQYAKFKIIFLIDDFTGSGTSYLKKDLTTQKYSGKIDKVLKNVYDENSNIYNMIDHDNLEICVLFYIATTKALTSIRHEMEVWLKEHNKNIKYEVISIQELTDNIRITSEFDKQFIDILKKYYDNSIEDKHYRKGDCSEPYLGFDKCGLPLILNHNTPNNSLPILWYEDDVENKKFIGLFPRVSRHRSEI